MSSEGRSGLRLFWILNSALFLLRLFLGFATVPSESVFWFSLVATVVFLGVPIVAIFGASHHDWTMRSGSVMVAAGAVAHIVGAVLLRTVMPAEGFGTIVIQSAVQTAIATWTFGLGALVAVGIKDKNMILPIAVFLAGLDVFLVFNPDAPTSKMVRQHPAMFESLAVNIPSVREATAKPEVAHIVSQAFVGAADMLFIATFFVLLARYKMRVHDTTKWMVPVMVAYLFIVLGPYGLNMLPALVPIGATVLIVNRKEFDMTKPEKVMTWFAVLFAVVLAGLGIYKHFTETKKAEPTVISTQADGQAPPGQGAMPPPASQGRSR